MKFSFWFGYGYTDSGPEYRFPSRFPHRLSHRFSHRFSHTGFHEQVPTQVFTHRFSLVCKQVCVNIDFPRSDTHLDMGEIHATETVGSLFLLRAVFI